MAMHSRLLTMGGLVLGLGAMLAAGCQGGSEEKTETPPADGGAKQESPTASGSGAAFATIQPLLQQRCAACHTGPGAKEGVDLSSHDAVMKGGREGAIVVAGDPDKSLLVDVLTGRNGKPQMPPKQAPLSADEIKTIEAWIKDGAKA